MRHRWHETQPGRNQRRESRIAEPEILQPGPSRIGGPDASSRWEETAEHDYPPDAAPYKPRIPAQSASSIWMRSAGNTRDSQVSISGGCFTQPGILQVPVIDRPFMPAYFRCTSRSTCRTERAPHDEAASDNRTRERIRPFPQTTAGRIGSPWVADR